MLYYIFSKFSIFFLMAPFLPPCLAECCQKSSFHNYIRGFDKRAPLYHHHETVDNQGILLQVTNNLYL